MDLLILKKIESSILNGLGYIVRLKKKNGIKIYRRLQDLSYVVTP